MENSEIKLGIILSYVSLALNNFVTILYTPFLLRMLGQSEYGLYSIVAAVISYLTVLDMGLGNTIVRYSALYKSRGSYESLYALFGLFIKIYSIISIVALVFGGLLLFNIDSIFSQSLTDHEISRARIMFLLLILNLSISFPLSIFGSIITAYQKFIFSKAVNIIRIVLQPIIMIPLLIWGYKAIAMTIVISLLNIATLLANVIYCYKKLEIRVYFNKTETKILKEIVVFSFFVFLGVAVDKMNWSTGQMILGIYSGTAQVAIYAVAIQVLLCYFGFASSMSGIFLPKITEIVSKGNEETELSHIFIKIGRLQYILLLMVFLGFLFFGKDFVRLWAGGEYVQAYYISLIVMIPLTFTAIQHTGVLILQAQNKQKFRSITYFIVAITNILISIRAAKHFGAYGCASTYALCMLIGNVIIMNRYYQKEIHLKIIDFWKEILKSVPLLIIMVTIGITLRRFLSSQTISSLLLNIAIFALSYIPLCYWLYMDQYEKSIFNKIINNCKKIW